MCYGYEGIDAVKDSLRAGLNFSTEDMPIKVIFLTLYFTKTTVLVLILASIICIMLEKNRN